MITHHTDLLNALIEKYNLVQAYLEIGINNPDANFNKINALYKIGVDPCLTTQRIDNGILIGKTSDDYFNTELGPFDLIFIDGLHHADQVKRDFENSLRCISPNGRIVIHDVLPENEQGTLVPRQTKQWWGDVYKWAMTLRNYSGVRFVTYNIDNGCMVVWKDETAEPYLNYVGPCDWLIYKAQGRVLLNVTDEVDI